MQGKENIGKTITLRKVLNLLATHGSLLAQEKPSLAKRLANGWDTWAVFEYNGRCIAITTRGDSDKLIKDDFTEMEQEAVRLNRTVDTYVCAVHLYGKTLNCVKGKAKALKADYYILGKATCKSNNTAVETALRDDISDVHAQMIFNIL